MRLTSGAGGKLHFLFCALCVTGAAWFIAVFIYVALSSLTYPFNLEWMEAQTIDVIQRVRDGLPVYAEPSIDYVAFIYTPLYYYISALVSLATGVGFLAPRLVSFMSILGCGVVLYQWVIKERGGRAAAIIAAGLFFSTYRMSGRWFDNARIDSLFMFFTMAGCYVFLFYRGWKHELLASILLTAGFFTKQTTLMIALPMLAAAALADTKHGLRTFALFAVMLIAGIAIADWWSDGWFNFFVFEVPAGHGIERSELMNFWRRDLLHGVGLLMAVSAVMFSLWCIEDWRKYLPYAGFVAGCVAASYISRMHMYGWINVLMPAHFALALTAALAYGYFARNGESAVAVVMLCVLMLHMKRALYDPAPLIPTRQSVEIGNRFLQEIGKIEGDVFMPELQYVQTRVGKRSYTLGMAAFDVIRANIPRHDNVKIKLEKEIDGALRSGRFTMVMPGRLLLLPNLYFYYKYTKHIDYPPEYVSGAINSLRTDLYFRQPITPDGQQKK